MTHIEKGLSSLIILFSLVLVGTIIYLTYSFGHIPLLTTIAREELSQKFTQTITTGNSLNEDSPNEDWVTYTNTKYKYLVQYPPDFKHSAMFTNVYPDVSISPSVVISSKNSFQTIMIYGDYARKSNQNLEEFVKKDTQELSLLRGSSLSMISNTVINDSQAIYVSNNDSDDLQLSMYILGSGDYIIKIELGSIYKGQAEKYKSNFYKITSTFKIIT